MEMLVCFGLKNIYIYKKKMSVLSYMRSSSRRGTTGKQVTTELIRLHGPMKEQVFKRECKNNCL